MKEILEKMDQKNALMFIVNALKKFENKYEEVAGDSLVHTAILNIVVFSEMDGDQDLSEMAQNDVFQSYKSLAMSFRKLMALRQDPFCRNELKPGLFAAAQIASATANACLYAIHRDVNYAVESISKMADATDDRKLFLFSLKEEAKNFLH